MKKAPCGVLVCNFLNCPLLNLIYELSVIGSDEIETLAKVLN